MMTPYMHKLLLNLRITLGVPATRYKDSDVKVSLPSSLENSMISDKKGGQMNMPEDPL